MKNFHFLLQFFVFTNFIQFSLGQPNPDFSTNPPDQETDDPIPAGPPGPVTCPPVPVLANPPGGCNYDTTTNDDGCPISWILVCNHECQNENEESREFCGCEPNCRGNPKICTRNCRRDCFCKSGFLRASNGHCVHDWECSNNDNDCSGNKCGQCQKCIQDPKKCFTQPCPQYRCEPINDCRDDNNHEKSGKCPSENPHWRHNNDCHDRCHRDSNCSGNKKCCDSSCGRRCWNPGNDHH